LRRQGGAAPHSAPAPAPSAAEAPAGQAAPAAPAPGARAADARAGVPAVPAPQRLNAAAATARLPLLSAVDALSVQQQATILASAPDVALCAGNGFVVEVVNQVGAWRTAAAQSTVVMPGNATCMRSHAGKASPHPARTCLDLCRAAPVALRQVHCAAAPPMRTHASYRGRPPPQLMAVFAVNGSTVTPPSLRRWRAQGTMALCLHIDWNT